MSKNRVISLLPSCTEIVCWLGCEDQLVGRSHECDFPAEVKRLPACTSAKINAEASSSEIDRAVKDLVGQALSIYDINVAKIKELRPDLILTQTQCEVCAVSEADLKKALAAELDFQPEIISVAPMKLADVWADIGRIATALGVSDRSKEPIQKLKTRVVDIIEKTCLMKNRPGVACLEWIEPLMGAGNWVPELVDFAGGRNLFGEAGKHSGWLDFETIQKRDPAIMVVMPCGFDIERTRKEMGALVSRPGWKALRAVRTGKVYLTDGNQYFNRPGPRLIDSLEILAEIIHPDIFEFGHEGKGWVKL